MPKNHATHAAAPALTLYTVRLVTEVTAAPDATPETVLAEVLRGLRDGDAYNFEIFAGDDNAAAPVTVCNNDCVAAGQVAPAQTGGNDRARIKNRPLCPCLACKLISPQSSPIAPNANIPTTIIAILSRRTRTIATLTK